MKSARKLAWDDFGIRIHRSQRPGLPRRRCRRLSLSLHSNSKEDDYFLILKRMYTSTKGADETRNANSENTVDKAISRPRYSVIPAGIMPNNVKR